MVLGPGIPVFSNLRIFLNALQRELFVRKFYTKDYNIAIDWLMACSVFTCLY